MGFYRISLVSAGFNPIWCDGPLYETFNTFLFSNLFKNSNELLAYDFSFFLRILNAF